MVGTRDETFNWDCCARECPEIAFIYTHLTQLLSSLHFTTIASKSGNKHRIETESSELGTDFSSYVTRLISTRKIR